MQRWYHGLGCIFALMAQGSLFLAAQTTQTFELQVQQVSREQMLAPPKEVPQRTETPAPKLSVDLPFFDLPYQGLAQETVGKGFLGSYQNPSMAQALGVSETLYQSVHYGIAKVFPKYRWKGAARWVALAGFQYAMTYLPGGDTWVHEEFHRAVMTKHKVSSFNDVYTFPFGASSIAVSRVKDVDLARMKRESNADFVRMGASGIEGQYLLIDRLQRHNFFHRQDLPNLLHYWMNTMNSYAYVQTSSRPETDEETDKMNAEDGLNVEKRDFTGFDFTAWAYDLFHPNEAYSQRGVHPSGLGVDRYIKHSDLADEEVSFLDRQAKLQLLNFISPMMLGRNRIRLGWDAKGQAWSGNFALRHLLTSFGSAASLQVWLQNPHLNLAVSAHRYENYQNSFWGLEGELIEKAFLLANKPFEGDARALIWSQPKAQTFKTDQGGLGGYLGLTLRYAGHRAWLPYLALQGKTAGWMAGVPFLEKNFSAKLGLSLRLY